MNVCFFCGSVSSKGGTERVSSMIASELKKKHNIFFLSLYNGIEPSFPVEGCNNYQGIFTNLKEFKFKYLHIVRYLRKYLKDNNIDVIIDVDSILSLYSTPALIGLKVKHVTWEHFNYNVDFGMKSRRIARWLAAKFSNDVVTLTNEDKLLWGDNLKPKAYIKHIYNPVLKSEVTKTSRSDSKVILAVGRLTQQKGFDRLLVIWKEIHNNFSDWRLCIVGEGEDKPKLLDYIKKHQLKNVELLPYTDQIQDYYTTSDIYIMTSRFEGFPMVLLEASTYGLPMISFDCRTGPKELILDGVNGYLVENDNIEEFIFKLSSMMNNIERLNELSHNSLMLSKRFIISEIIKEWEEIIGK